MAVLAAVVLHSSLWEKAPAGPIQRDIEQRTLLHCHRVSSNYSKVIETIQKHSPRIEMQRNERQRKEALLGTVFVTNLRICCMYLNYDQPQEALRLSQDAYNQLKRLRGQKHASTICAGNYLAWTLSDLKQQNEAENLLLKILEEAPKFGEASCSPLHREQLLETLRLLGHVHVRGEAWEKAQETLCKAKEQCESLRLRQQLGITLHRLGEYYLSRALSQRSDFSRGGSPRGSSPRGGSLRQTSPMAHSPSPRAGTPRQHSPPHSLHGSSQGSASRASSASSRRPSPPMSMTRNHDLKSAEKEFREALRLKTLLFGPKHPSTLRSMASLGETLLQNPKKLAEARSMTEGAVREMENFWGVLHTDTQEVRMQLGYICWRLGERNNARRQYESAHLSLIQRVGPSHEITKVAFNNLRGCRKSGAGNDDTAVKPWTLGSRYGLIAGVGSFAEDNSVRSRDLG